VVEQRVAIVLRRGRQPVGGQAVQRGVLAEVLHPAVESVVDGLLQEVAVERRGLRVREIDLGDRVPAGAHVVVDVRGPVQVLGEDSCGRGGRPRRVVLPADHRVEVGGRRVPGVVVGGGERPLAVGTADVSPAGQVVRVGLPDGGRGVGRLQLRDGAGIGLVGVGLEPGSEHGRGDEGRLASQRRRQPPDDVDGARAGEHLQAQRGAGGLDAPDVLGLAAEVVHARLVVADEHPVPRRRHEPRHGKVGGVEPRVIAVLRQESRDGHVVLLRVRAFSDVALHIVATLVDGIGPFAEAEEALVLAHREPRPGGGDPGRGRDRGGDAQRAVRSRHDPHRKAATGGVVGGDRGRERGAPPGHRGHPGGVPPHPVGVEAQAAAGVVARPRGLGQHGTAAAVPDHEVPRPAIDGDAQRPGGHRRRLRGRGHRRRRYDQRNTPRRPAPLPDHASPLSPDEGAILEGTGTFPQRSTTRGPAC